MGLFSTVPGCTWVYLAVPASALVCYDLPYHKLPTLIDLNAYVQALMLNIYKWDWTGWDQNL